MLQFPEISNQKAKRSLSNFFKQKSSLENVCSFLTPKEKFRFLCNSKKVAEELDSRIDDAFMPREYQEKIKDYENYYEDLFYKLLMEKKRKAEIKGEKIKLYEFENDMVNYLKYLNRKFDKTIKLSLIKIIHMEPWKIDFISKLISSLEKNIHLVISMDLKEFERNDFYINYVKPSKAINTVEIVDILYQAREIIMDDFMKSVFNWNNVKKLIIKSNEIDSVNLVLKKPKNYGFQFLNNAELPNLEELDLNCKIGNFHRLDHFLYKCSKVKKLSVYNIKFVNYNDIEDNSVLKSFNNITDLKIETNSDNLEQLLYYFYPIFPKIRNFHLIISTDKNEDLVDLKELIKTQKKPKINSQNREYEQFANEYLKDDIIGNSHDLAAKKFSFSIENIMAEEKFNNRKITNFISDKTDQVEESDKIDLNKNKILSTLLNLKQCESLTYEIKEQKSLINSKRNKINNLINIIENNKLHLKYLDINIYNDEAIIIDINQFSALIQKISECKKLNTFILRFELTEEYAKIFNEYFHLGSNLNKISLIHSKDLNIMTIINEHPNLNSISLELIMNEPNYTKTNYENYAFDLDVNRKWKEIDLTNYPINSKNMDYLKNNRNIDICLSACVNLTEMDDMTFRQMAKTFIN